MKEADDQFNGVISGYETEILLNSERLYIKIESQSKEYLYESLIQYKNDDTVLKQVKNIFTNLTLLFEYINEFSQDPQRIKVDLVKNQMRIIKNEGPKRLKNAPVLVIPLQRKFVFQKKQKTPLQIEIQRELKQNEITEFKFTHLKRQRKKLLSQYEEMQQWMKNYCKQNEIEYVEEENQNISTFDKDDELEKILEKGDLSYSIDGKEENLFFESEPIQREQKQLQGQNLGNFLNKHLESRDYSSNKQENCLSYDPFSYM